MKKYYYAKMGEALGPYTPKELLYEGITHETFIWYDGIENWIQAKDLVELNAILNIQPPLIPLNTTQQMPASTSLEKEIKLPPPIPGFGDEQQSSSPLKPSWIFAAPFSFTGRIRRLEFGISFLIFFFPYMILSKLAKDSPLANIPLFFIYWFIIAQGAKRCHDLGNSGWFQIIPFYGFWMLFQEGKIGQNKYGWNPKGKY
jgi:uncharacterized membrane protein YhaH (DUF805 family)